MMLAITQVSRLPLRPAAIASLVLLVALVVNQHGNVAAVSEPEQVAVSLGVSSVARVNRVYFTAGGVESYFEQVGDSAEWKEIKVDGSGFFAFKETARDPWTIYLDSTDRPGVRIYLDVWRKWAVYSDDSVKLVDLYPLTRVTEAPVSLGVTSAQDVNVVYFEVAGGAESYFKQVSYVGEWREMKVDGSGYFPFMETHRDQWSIYLDSTDRPGVKIQLDIWRKWAVYSDGSKRFDLYRLTHVDEQATKW